VDQARPRGLSCRPIKIRLRLLEGFPPRPPIQRHR
jgi:hypothetical protein